ncbi:hypothetical protein WN51_07602 [Melipona quadrifasciata]|uniref:Uncharacterized protein n=1 Tax=Melipona quadrifasciata TaxID=166423 RepID=A0A0M8ZNQ5_9HYME|nr:hypothetical protein WN51_07602 [Melipona quadrifasciata]
MNVRNERNSRLEEESDKFNGKEMMPLADQLLYSQKETFMRNFLFISFIAQEITTFLKNETVFHLQYLPKNCRILEFEVTRCWNLLNSSHSNCETVPRAFRNFFDNQIRRDSCIIAILIITLSMAAETSSICLNNKRQWITELYLKLGPSIDSQREIANFVKVLKKTLLRKHIAFSAPEMHLNPRLKLDQSSKIVSDDENVITVNVERYKEEQGRCRNEEEQETKKNEDETTNEDWTITKVLADRMKDSRRIPYANNQPVHNSSDTFVGGQPTVSQ